MKTVKDLFQDINNYDKYIKRASSIEKNWPRNLTKEITKWP